MAAVLLYNPLIGEVFESGDKLYAYETNTSTPVTLYTDDDLSVAHATPVVADSTGRFAPIYADATGGDLKITVTDSDDVNKFTCDPFIISDLTSLTSTVNTNTGNISSIDGRLTTAESEIDTLQTESADYESRVSALEGATTPVLPADFNDQTLAAAGHQYLPTPGSGTALLFNWDTRAGAGTYSWEEAFPNACLNAVATLNSVSGTATNTHIGISYTSTQYTITLGVDVAGATVHVQAIGY